MKKEIEEVLRAVAPHVRMTEKAVVERFILLSKDQQDAFIEKCKKRLWEKTTQK